MTTVSPGVPMRDALDLKHLGKLAEEINELGSATARCMIQGIDESEPVTGKLNRRWLEEEIADVRANLALVEKHFGLDTGFIDERAVDKMKRLALWHAMTT